MARALFPLLLSLCWVSTSWAQSTDPYAVSCSPPVIAPPSGIISDDLRFPAPGDFNTCLVATADQVSGDGWSSTCYKVATCKDRTIHIEVQTSNEVDGQYFEIWIDHTLALTTTQTLPWGSSNCISDQSIQAHGEIDYPLTEGVHQIRVRFAGFDGHQPDEIQSLCMHDPHCDIRWSWPIGKVVVTGRLVFNKYPEDVQLPMRSIVAALYDSASNGQEQQLAVTSTDPNGYFTFPCVDVLRASDGEPINPFVRAYYYSDSTQFNGVTAIIVRRSTLDEPIWTFDSNAIVACAGTDPNHSVLQMGSICPPSSNYGPNAAMYIYTTMLRGWDWLAQRLDFTNPNLVMNATAVRWTPMMWSESAMADTTGTIIDVAGAYEATGTYSPDELDENVLLHEYGHLIAHRYHFATSIVDTAKSHSLWTQSTVGNPPQASTAFAWSEGWADYFGVIASSTAAARTFTDIGIYSDSTTKDKFWGDLERGFAQTQNPLGNPTGSYSLNDSGATYEMTVAATLWDIFDASNDDQPPTGCSDAYAEDASHTFTLGAARGMTGTEKDILTFFSSYLNLHSGDLGPLCDLFCEHGLAPSQCNGGGGGGGGGGGQHDGGARTSGLARKVPSVWPEVDGTGAVRVLAFAAGAGPARVDLFDVSGRRISTLWSGYVTVPGVPVRIPVPRSIGGSSMVFARLACSAGIASTRFVVIR